LSTGKHDGAERRSGAVLPRRILVVEDNLDNVHSLVFLLRDQGHIVEYAINGYAALAAAKQFHPEFLLLDLGLPGMDGFDLCRRVRSDPGLRNVRVIAITAYGDEESRRRSAEAGCEAHYAKPVNLQALEEIFRR
jgi:two-component system, chemotaxis family, CheB/CheR fusion protein